MDCRCTSCPSNGFCSDRQEVNSNTDFQTAKTLCENIGLELPVPSSAAEAAIALGSSSHIWLGISDETSEGTWVNVHDSTTPSYLPWEMDDTNTSIAIEPNDCCTYVPFLTMAAEQETG